MVFRAFLMRPWVLKMKDMEAKPRVLADDIMVSIAGKDSYDRFIPVFDATLQYCIDFKAWVAPGKYRRFRSIRNNREPQ